MEVIIAYFMFSLYNCMVLHMLHLINFSYKLQLHLLLSFLHADKQVAC
jgi:hypothetical protein